MNPTRNSKYSSEIKQQAKDLYLTCLTPKEIAQHLNINSVRTVYHWINREGWNKLHSAFSLEQLLLRRVQILTDRDMKKRIEVEELDRLVRMLVKVQAANLTLKEREMSLREREAALKSPGFQPGEDGGKGGSSKRKKRPRKNDIPPADDPRWQEWIDKLYAYQKVHFDARNLKERWTIKSRQIGFTFEAAGEALYVARETGRNQTFLSASKAQSLVFRSYITSLAQEVFGIELRGEIIRLPNGAELRFLGTNRATAQSYSSDLYIDEACWIPKFEGIYETASAMTTLSTRRLTVFSTPSTRQHGAYRIWSGAYWKAKDRSRTDIPFPDKDTLRKYPQVCADKRWRYVVTAQDAVDGGNTEIDIDDLKERYPAHAFEYLFNAEFIDEMDSIFALSQIERCIRQDFWRDVDLSEVRPYGDKPVAIGYDPARTGDLARVYVVAMPDSATEPFRVIEQFEYRGFNWSWQAEQIRRLTERYHVKHIGVDTSGIGSGVGELVKAFFPTAMLISYTQHSKQQLVLKMMDLVSTGRLKWPAQFETIAPSFMAIKKKQTGHGTMTFAAERSEDIGHADDFFAISHAVACEDLNVAMRRKTTIRTGL